MAEIPIEKKTTSSWLWVILGLIALVAVIAIWAALDDNDAEYDEIATVETEPIAAETATVVVPIAAGDEMQRDEPLGVITSTNTLQTASPAALDGQQLRIDQMKVTRVVGDKTFYVSEPQSEREFFVVLDEVKTPGTPTEGRYDVTAGQTVTITGTVEQRDEIDINNFDLTEQEAQAMRGDELYLRAQKLDIRS